METVDKHKAALLALIESGTPTEAAQAVLTKHPEMVESLAAKKLPELEAEAREDIRRKQEASPEGRLAAGQEAQKRQAERAEKLEAATALLAESGHDVSGFSEAELLHYSGIEPRDELTTQDERDRRALADPEYQRKVEIESLDTRWNQLSEDARRATCQELGIDFDAAVAEKEREGWAAVGLKPPSERGGSNDGSEGGGE